MPTGNTGTLWAYPSNYDWFPVFAFDHPTYQPGNTDLGGFSAGAQSAASALAGLSPGLVVAFLVYFVLGFALYAAIYAAAGSLVSRPEDVQMIALPLSRFLLGKVRPPEGEAEQSRADRTAQRASDWLENTVLRRVLATRRHAW